MYNVFRDKQYVTLVSIGICARRGTWGSSRCATAATAWHGPTYSITVMDGPVFTAGKLFGGRFMEREDRRDGMSERETINDGEPSPKFFGGTSGHISFCCLPSQSFIVPNLSVAHIVPL